MRLLFSVEQQLWCEGRPYIEGGPGIPRKAHDGSRLENPTRNTNLRAPRSEDKWTHRASLEPLLLVLLLVPLISPFPSPQPYIQRRFVPQDENLLRGPIPRLVAQFQIKVPEHSSQYRPHLSIGQVLYIESAWSSRSPLMLLSGPAFPRQPRGPRENGWHAARSSLA